IKNISFLERKHRKFNFLHGKENKMILEEKIAHSERNIGSTGKGKALILLIYLTVVQQIPFIRINYYSELRFVLYILFGLYVIESFLSFKTTLLNIFTTIFLGTFVFSLSLFIFTLLIGKPDYSLFELATPLFI